MRIPGRRIRAAIGMGLTWGFVWSGAGAVLARVPGFFSDLPFAIIFAPLGFAAGMLFSAILWRAARTRGFDALSLPRFAAWGGASGLLLSGIIVSGAAYRGEDVWREFLLFGPPLITASALCAAASLALARWATRRELAGRQGSPALAPPTVGPPFGQSSRDVVVELRGDDDALRRAAPRGPAQDR